MPLELLLHGRLDQPRSIDRLHLGQFGLCLPKDIEPADVTEINQQLDLWRGVLKSQFKLFGERVSVTTAIHPERDLLAVVVDSRLPDLAVRIAFPYGSPSMQAADWNQPDRHETRIIADGKLIARQLDGDAYYVTVQGQLKVEGRHSLRLTGSEFVIAFSQERASEALPTAAETIAASERHWQRFWTQGAAVELAHSKDKRAIELERRVVLSQYLTAIQCSGSMPPQETGLTVNSWYGKFHLEMHWWHATHFALWNRLPLFERSLRWYESILSGGVELARSQGYRGARWPKLVGPEGRDSPSPIGPLLIWQQPRRLDR